MIDVIVAKADYKYEILRPIVFHMIESLGHDLIRKDTRVLIKPNLLMGASCEKAITTHPDLVRAVAEYAAGKGGLVQISDSPPMGSFEKIIVTGGYDKALHDIDCRIKELDVSKKVYIGKPFGKIDIALDAMEADVVINLPKLKTHAQMLLTLGVKNLFGSIVGYKKPEWHFRTGVNREMFARLLVQICNAVNPSITILDGILAMEGEGPGKKGKPRELGILAASRSPVAVDIAVCSMLGIASDSLPTNKAAKELGFDQDINIKGDFDIVNDFKLPQMGSLTFGSKYLHGITRRYLTQRPVPDKRICKLCGKCSEICPPKVIQISKEKISIDYDSCIRCYCCIEICPHGAISAKETVAGRFLRKILMVF